MIDTDSRKLKKFEKILIGFFTICLVIPAMWIAFGHNQNSRQIEIIINGKQYDSIDLNQVISPYEIHLQTDFPVTLQVTSQGVRFIDSQCPDHRCESFGIVPAQAESAVCLPAKVVVRVKKDTEIIR